MTITHNELASPFDQCPAEVREELRRWFDANSKEQLIDMLLGQMSMEAFRNVLTDIRTDFKTEDEPELRLVDHYPALYKFTFGL